MTKSHTHVMHTLVWNNKAGGEAEQPQTITKLMRKREARVMPFLMMWIKSLVFMEFENFWISLLCSIGLNVNWRRSLCKYELHFEPSNWLQTLFILIHHALPGMYMVIFFSFKHVTPSQYSHNKHISQHAITALKRQPNSRDLPQVVGKRWIRI